MTEIGISSLTPIVTERTQRKDIDSLSENKVTIEGANASKIVNDVALKKGLEMAIIKMTYRVVHENYNPVDAIKEFMSRNPSKERN